MSTPHNRAEKGDFAKTVLMPGDPLRAKFIAETFLENPRLVTDVRGMYGFTGTYQGRPISVMGSGMGMPQNEQEQLNNETRRSFGIAGKSALSSAELNDIQAHTFNNASKMPDSNGAYAPGVYYVGTDIPAGGYWLTGKEDELSNFYILKPSGTGQATLYNTVHVNSYYGHNLTNLEDGEVLILDNDGTMVSLDQMKETFSAPYGSGVYRVGVDVPEGTYQLVVGDGADDYSACYVMADLDYDETSSYLYSDYFVKGDKAGTVTLKAGTYIELYNMQMKPDGLA